MLIIAPQLVESLIPWYPLAMRIYLYEANVSKEPQEKLIGRITVGLEIGSCSRVLSNEGI